MLICLFADAVHGYKLNITFAPWGVCLSVWGWAFVLSWSILSHSGTACQSPPPPIPPSLLCLPLCGLSFPSHSSLCGSCPWSSPCAVHRLIPNQQRRSLHPRKIIHIQTEAHYRKDTHQEQHSWTTCQLLEHPKEPATTQDPAHICGNLKKNAVCALH